MSVQGPVVDVQCMSEIDVPNIHSILRTKTVEDKDIILEVAEHQAGNIARCISIHSTLNLQYKTSVYLEGASIMIPSGEDIFSRIVNVLGEPIDQKGPTTVKETFPIRNVKETVQVRKVREGVQQFERLETGIKMIDLLFPLVKGSKMGDLGRNRCVM